MGLIQLRFGVLRSVAKLSAFPRIWACFFVELRFFRRLAGCLLLSLF